MTWSIDRLRRAVADMTCASALALCGSAVGGPLATAEADLAKSDPRDRTLYLLQAGLHAIRENQRVRAASYFDEALAAIESVYSNADGAAKARSLWYEEGSKDYKGEPYERAMAYYYRGLLYLADTDYENARASFRSGLMQSSFAEEQQYRSGFATLMFLEGWASQLLKDPQATDAYAEAARYRPQWQRPDADANALVIVELAGSPRKVGDGIGNHEIVYRKARRTPEVRAELRIADRALPPLFPMEDLFHQATHRGPRAIDRIIDGKVSFRDASASVGGVLGALASEGSVLNAGLGGSAGRALGGLAAAGAISSLISMNVKARADVRYWANLPEQLHLTATRLGEDGSIEVTLFDGGSQPVAGESLVANRWIDRNGNQLIWVKTRP